MMMMMFVDALFNLKKDIVHGSSSRMSSWQLSLYEPQYRDCVNQSGSFSLTFITIRDKRIRFCFYFFDFPGFLSKYSVPEMHDSMSSI